ncbi:retron St85 family RNA-directed DNA polymerase [Chromobacterium haemolyticum]|nr:retron St85 family RNA-directed DNA polymerase [Chromobacterium haemolyticum]
MAQDSHLGPFPLGKLMGIIYQLAEKLEMSELTVKKYLANAPNKYKVYKIPKRTYGFRIIAQPAKELKKFQRAFLDVFDLPVHNSALAYRKSISIKDNAILHCKNAYLLKMDLENFFNSITPDLFWKEWNKTLKILPRTEAQWLELLLFWRPSKKRNGKLILSIGAPSSPHISNFCLFNFDIIMSTKCEALGITYSRYADDLTFSTNKKNILFTIPKFVDSILTASFDGKLTINKNKTVFSSKAHNRHVTGITITNDGNISIGREKKRIIKHLVHNYKIGTLPPEEIDYLKGLLAFSGHIDPTFIDSLKKNIQQRLSKKYI